MKPTTFRETLRGGFEHVFRGIQCAIAFKMTDIHFTVNGSAFGGTSLLAGTEFSFLLSSV